MDRSRPTRGPRGQSSDWRPVWTGVVRLEVRVDRSRPTGSHVPQHEAHVKWFLETVLILPLNQTLPPSH